MSNVFKIIITEEEQVLFGIGFPVQYSEIFIADDKGEHSYFFIISNVFPDIEIMIIFYCFGIVFKS